MSFPISGVAVRTAAGDLDGVWASLAAPAGAFGPPPYPTEGLANPSVASVAGLDRDAPAEALLEEVVAKALGEADLPDDAVVGLVVGTSSGNVCGPWERWHRAVLAGEEADESRGGRDVPTLRAAARFGLRGPVATVSAVCVSGAAVFAVALGWLAEGLCGHVVVAGVDALSLYVHAGFSGLGALTASVPRPFHPDRDGLLLGEGAAAVVVSREHPRPIAWLRGAAIASDARHMTAPDPDAGGAVAALRGALDAAGLDASSVDALSVHGTGTRFNDATEAVAIAKVFGGGPLAVHGLKHRIGHTMGASGAIEVALMADALRRGVLPPPLRPPPGPPADPAPTVAAYADRAPTRAHVGVTLSAAFGGLDAAVVLADHAGPARPRWDVVAGPVVTVDRADADATDLPRASRLDVYTRAGLVALDRLRALAEVPSEVALVLATRSGCRVVDLAYHERVVREGAAQASRLAFTYTLPGAPLAEASIRFGWRGPQVPFVGNLTVAEEEARRWIRVHGAPAAIALQLDAPDPDGGAFARATLWIRRDMSA